MSQVRNLPTEGGLRNSQPMRSAREIQLFGQNYYRIQMSNIDLGEHRLKALGARNTWTFQSHPTSI